MKGPYHLNILSFEIITKLISLLMVIEVVIVMKKLSRVLLLYILLRMCTKTFYWSDF